MKLKLSKKKSPTGSENGPYLTFCSQLLAGTKSYKLRPTAYGVLHGSLKMLSTVINTHRFATLDGLAGAEESLKHETSN